MEVKSVGLTSCQLGKLKTQATILFVLCIIYFFSPGEAGRLHFPNIQVAKGMCAKVMCVPSRPDLYRISHVLAPCPFPSCCDTGDGMMRQVASPDRRLSP